MTRLLQRFAMGCAFATFAWATAGSGGVGAESGTGAQVFSFQTADVARGARVYAASCAACHGGALQGGNGPNLTGAAFLARWVGGDRTYETLHEAIVRMPKQAPGSLPKADYAAVTAFILAKNGYATGPVPAAQLSGLDARIAAPAGAAVAATSSAPAVNLPSAPASVVPSVGSAPTDAELLAPAAGDWLMFNRTYAGNRHSPLNQITTANAGQLQPICVMQLGVPGSFQSSPIIYKGAGYVSAANSLFAFDPTNCQRRWQYAYTPDGVEGFRTNRGIALYDGKLYRGTSDAHLIAVDAQTGKVSWDVHVADSAFGYGIGAAPVVYKGKVIVGLAGGDYGIPGHVYAFDARTGALVWSFDTIDAKSWKLGAERGGGATWTHVAVDPKDGTVFVPVGNPAPDFNPDGRPGDNLYTNSVVAIDAETGKVRWHVQQLPADYHDWDTAAAPALYEQDGKRYMAVGTKAGYLYIYDRDTHKLVSRTTVVKRENNEVPLGDKPVHVCPGGIAGVEWNGPAYDPQSKSVFVNSIEWCITLQRNTDAYKKGVLYVQATAQLDPQSTVSGWTRAFDAATGAEKWAMAMPGAMTGAVTTTGCGVVMTGGADGDFRVLDQASGKLLYRFATGGEIQGGISTYEVEGKQYVAVASGGAGLVPFGPVGAPTLLVFALKP